MSFGPADRRNGRPHARHHMAAELGLDDVNIGQTGGPEVVCPCRPDLLVAEPVGRVVRQQQHPARREVADRNAELRRCGPAGRGDTRREHLVEPAVTEVDVSVAAG